uniref:Uncharacterized protein n=1 Tax=Spongospora subterranea TaxID=70186 RepID=A0A0H5QZ39_9EUKA|eukprot:CRZ06956.1 hypothetical protein [Spongospora subterranea]
MWILFREDLIVELSIFESVGSDPWRLFMGLSHHRLVESDIRQTLSWLLGRATKSIDQLLQGTDWRMMWNGEEYRFRMGRSIMEGSNGHLDHEHMMARFRRLSTVLGNHGSGHKMIKGQQVHHDHHHIPDIIKSIPRSINPYYEEMIGLSSYQVRATEVVTPESVILTTACNDDHIPLHDHGPILQNNQLHINIITITQFGQSLEN